MNLKDSSHQVAQALKNNPHCITGVFIDPRVFAREKGKGDKPELLSLLYADLYAIYVYGHVFYSEATQSFVACLVEFDQFISGRDVDHLFARFDWFIEQKGNWQPLTIQEEWNAFALCQSFEEACMALTRMIEAFSLEKRSPFEEDAASDDPTDYRILSVYPFPSCHHDTWQAPPY